MAFLVLEADHQLVALPLNVVREVVRSGLVSKLPRAPFGCMGTIDVRGEVVPLLSLATLVGLASPPKPEVIERALVEGHVVLCDFDGAVVALLATRALDLVEAEVSGLPQGASPVWARSAELVAGTVRHGEQTVWVLKPDSLVRHARRRMLKRAVSQGDHA